MNLRLNVGPLMNYKIMANISKKVLNRLESLKSVYKNNSNCMGEILANEPANNLTLEEAHELYMLAQNYANGDRFYTVLGDDPGWFRNCFDEDDVIEDYS